METETKVESSPIVDYNAAWYESLSKEGQKRVLTDAITIYPYLKNHMKLNGIKGSDKDFTKHFCFRMMTDVLRSQ